MASACFAAIVRTMGDRPQLLQEALESLTSQRDRGGSTSAGKPSAAAGERPALPC